MVRRRFVLTGALAVAAWCSSASAQVTLTPVKDNTLYEDVSGSASNGAGQYFFTGRTQFAANIRRGLVAFDIAGSIPASSTINSAELTLNMSRTPSITMRTTTLHRVLADWGEGTSDAFGQEGTGTASATGDATWLHTFFDTDFWSTAGGDFSPTVSGSVNVAGLGPYTWGSTLQMVADVQMWLDNPASNFGWIVIGDEGFAGTAKRFDSREHPTPTNRPMLTINFTPPPAIGACCDDLTGVCTEDVEFGDCLANGRRFGGDLSDCNTIDPRCLPTGACCDEITGVCTGGVLEGDCSGAGERYGGNASTCATLDPACVPPPVGACCVEPSGACQEGVTNFDCASSGGRFGGDGSTCATIDPPCEPPISISLELIAGGAATVAGGGPAPLVAPLFLTHAGDGSGRLFIIDQIGQIRIVKNGVLLPDPFLDVSSKIITINETFDERGLLGLAFHPDYANNGRFFVRYSVPRAGDPAEPCNDPKGFVVGCHTAVLAEYAVSGDPDVADPNSEIILFEVDEPQFNHNAGQVMFGPDGFLYFTLGDGGGAHDGLADDPPPHGPFGNGQNVDTVLGSVLRINVGFGVVLPDDFPGDPDRNYGIPAGNPFAGGGGAPEIYAYGFRNPYRFSFANVESLDNVVVADVGQNLFEEINFVPVAPAPGLLNYGWVIREGFSCFDPSAPNEPPATCASAGTQDESLIDPDVDYPHPTPCVDDAECAALATFCKSDGFCANPSGIAVVGGFVYRGSGYPPLDGRYVFGDFGQDFFTPSGRLFYMDVTGPDAFKIREFFLFPDGAPFGQALFGIGEDEDGELYVLASDNIGPTGTTGAVYRIVPPLPAASGVSPRYLAINAPPNPEPFKLFVTPTCPAGTGLYVGTPFGPENIAELVANPAFAAELNSSEWSQTVHVTGIDVVPGTGYNVQVDTGPMGSPVLSAAATAATTLWGDVAGTFGGGVWLPPDGDHDFDDIAAVVDTFVVLPSAMATFRADLVGPAGNDCDPGQVIDFGDISAVVDAFIGFDYTASTSCPEPCP